jgi:hypothetical protein
MQLTLKSDCCCSIGLAWGSPCEPCKQDDCGGECNKGYVVSCKCISNEPGISSKVITFSSVCR